MGRLSAQADKRPRYGAILVIYLTGLLVGGLYVGMVIPARMVVQYSFGIDSNTGIWMINIYTLFYAALIPTIGKLADRHGRKRIFMICVLLFGAGSLMCGLSEQIGGFGALLVARVVQAIGAGGMIPVANAEIGTAFPEDKRGMALGLAAAVTGVANMLGSVCGSAILGFAGPDNWSIMFYIAVPLCVVLAIGAVAFLPNHTVEARGKLDVAGSVLFTLFVLMLLLGIRGIDFTDITGSAIRLDVWLPLLGAIIIIPAFMQVECRAEDAIFSPEYVRNEQIVIILAVSFFIGCSIISMTVIPEFAEFALGLNVGEGGYFVGVIGLFSVVGPPLAGKFIDRFGAKPVLIFGLSFMVLGYGLLTVFSATSITAVTMVIGLAVVGFGMGFAMGAPTNYMILENTSADQSTSAIATVTLVRQIGTSLAPAIFVSLIAQSPGMPGFEHMLVCIAVFNLISVFLMLFYRGRRRSMS